MENGEHEELETFNSALIYSDNLAESRYRSQVFVLHLLSETFNMRSKKVSIQVKKASLGLKKQNESVRKKANTIGLAKSTIRCIFKKKESAGILSNAKRPGKTAKVDDGGVISLVKKNPLTMPSQVKNTLGEVGASLSRSVTIKNRKPRFAKIHLIKST